MASHGSPHFEAYSRTLKRIFWVEFIEAQTQASRPSAFRASLVDPPLKETDNLAVAYEYHRHRVAKF